MTDLNVTLPRGVDQQPDSGKTASSSTNVTPSELDTRMEYWKTRLPWCTFAGGPRFPAKDQEDGTPCNDGDSVPLNGLTCAAGNDDGCNAVRDSQGKNGAFFRSQKNAMKSRIIYLRAMKSLRATTQLRVFGPI